jgi:single-stranded-DNA-specific exonuclease
VLKRPAPFTASDDIAAILAAERNIALIDSPTFSLSDPFLFPEMQKAVDRIELAMKKGETIGIFGDYDADGITGTAQLVRFFRRHNIEPVVYLPDRLNDGYGLKTKTVDILQSKNIKLLITVDTGIAAHNEIKLLVARGIDTIVTDHHRVQGGRPPAFAVIHPEVPSQFPNPHLSGSGVAFMLVRALEHAQIWDGIAEDALLAAIGTIGDVVPLTGENRLLVIKALGLIAKLAPSPLKDLIDFVGAGRALTSGDIAFRVVPRINAAGRIAHPDIALKALLEGGEHLERLHELNGERQSLVSDLVEEALETVDRTTPFIAIESEKFTPGIVGLIAGRLSETFGKPSIVGARVGSECVCSLRSIPEVDVMSCLENPLVRPYLLHYGGHAQAAGCSLTIESFPLVAAALSQSLADAGITSDILTPSIVIDAELPEAMATLVLAKKLSALEPFGQHNDEPSFVLKNQTITNIRTVGNENAHLQCRIGNMKAIGFGLGALAETIGSNPVDIVCRLSINQWNSKEEMQLIIEDIRK